MSNITELPTEDIILQPNKSMRFTKRTKVSIFDPAVICRVICMRTLLHISSDRVGCCEARKV